MLKLILCRVVAAMSLLKVAFHWWETASVLNSQKEVDCSTRNRSVPSSSWKKRIFKP